MATPFGASEMVDDVMRQAPATVRVFLKHGMACVGCTIAPFHSIGEASAIYGLDVDTFLDELAAAEPMT